MLILSIICLIAMLGFTVICALFDDEDTTFARVFWALVITAQAIPLAYLITEAVG
jgi:hypothetical protein